MLVRWEGAGSLGGGCARVYVEGSWKVVEGMGASCSSSAP